jgi:hypothetical protein
MVYGSTHWVNPTEAARVAAGPGAQVKPGRPRVGAAIEERKIRRFSVDFQWIYGIFINEHVGIVGILDG